MYFVLAILLATARPCVHLTLEADSYTLGGHRFDAPEHVRGLHVRGDFSGAQIRLPGPPERTFHLWALDTVLDGVERYDTLATSATDDIDDSPEPLVPLNPGSPTRVDTARGPIRLAVLSFDRDLRHLEICGEPYP
jgi:hypothetical protein